MPPGGDPLREVTFATFQHLLRGLGFTHVDTKTLLGATARVFVHKPSGAQVSTNIVHPRRFVRPIHVLSAKVTLDDFGILPADEFECRLKRAVSWYNRTMEVSMSGQPPAIGKRRTRAHVIADLSMNHVERVILESGHTAQRWYADYGYDLTMKMHDEQGNAEPGLVYFQLKATETLPDTTDAFPFDLDTRDYRLWTREVNPVILCLYEATKKRSFYVDVRTFFRDTPARRPAHGAKTVRILVPRSQRFNRRAVGHIRRTMNQLVLPLTWGVVR